MTLMGVSLQWTNHPFKEGRERSALYVEHAAALHIDRGLPPGNAAAKGLEAGIQAFGKQAIGDIARTTTLTPSIFKCPAFASGLFPRNAPGGFQTRPPYACRVSRSHGSSSTQSPNTLPGEYPWNGTAPAVLRSAQVRRGRLRQGSGANNALERSTPLRSSRWRPFPLLRASGPIRGMNLNVIGLVESRRL